MKITEITETTVFYVETDEKGWHEYTRHSADNWTVRMGESDETVYECKELEKMFQESKEDKFEGWAKRHKEVFKLTECKPSQRMADQRKVDEWFADGVSTAIEYADTSDFREGEVRHIGCNHSIEDVKNGKWDGKLPIKKNDELFYGDIGIDKDKNMYMFTNDKWKEIPND